jgi:D-glycero-D-manno-heptose 1,7-bisphosphate phosphatase
MKSAVFLDRDGTLIEDVGYLERLDRISFYPWSIDAVRLLNRAGFLVIVITNQAGVARGYFPEAFLADAHRYLDEKLAAGGATIARYYYCPHHPDGSVAAYRQACECRKPGPGMILQAQRDFDINLSRSFVVGDRWHDIQMGQAAGVRGLLVRTGYGGSEATKPRDSVKPAAVVAHLLEATSWILLNRAGDLR